MKNVSYFADLGSANRTGGGQTFALELFAILDKLPINLTAFCAFYPKIDKKIPVDSPKIKVVDLPFRSPFGIPEIGIPWSLKLYRQVKKMPPQDLYIFDQPATWFSMFPKAPAIVMFHGSDYIRIKPSFFLHPRSLVHALLWQKPVLNHIHRGFLTRQIGIPLFNSRFTLDILGRDFKIDTKPLEKYVVYLPVGVEAYKRDLISREKIRNRFNIGQDEILIIYLSNFAPKKRPDRVPPIVSKLLKKLPDEKVKFIFVGRGIASGPIDALMENKSLKGHCIRIGEIAPSDVQKFYSAADIALSTSESETFGYFVAEGMAAQVPFVAYAEGAIPEVIEDGVTGFLAKNENEFTDALVRLVKDRGLRQRMGRAGEERVGKLFSREAFGERFKKILREEFQFNL